jgi:hypothetical protein
MTMSRAKVAVQRFVRTLLPDHVARKYPSGFYEVRRPDRTARLPAAEVETLVRSGVLVGEGETVRAAAEARAWLVRHRSAGNPFLAQNAELVPHADGAMLNIAESPLARLAMVGADGSAPFLEPHQVDAGERIRRLAERAQMVQRTTLSYDPTRTATGARQAPGGIADSALDARRVLGNLLDTLPRDCAGVVLDVCGMLKGLQAVEAERGWPRRSAKIVLRIGLEQAAMALGLGTVAQGRERGRMNGWLGERPMRFE